MRTRDDDEPTVLVFRGGRYLVTEEDRMWLLRAVQAEGPPQRGVACALVNGFCWARAERRYPGSLMAWVRSYAQPCNPAWYIGGNAYKLSLVGRSEEDCNRAAQRAHAREVKHSRRTDFTPSVVMAVNDALSVPCTTDVTDYAAFDVDARAKGYQPRGLVVKGHNRFWTRAPGWTGYTVELRDGDEIA